MNDPPGPTKHDDTRHLYDTAQVANVVSALREVTHPSGIGPYSIIELIGEGGMGTVYKAEQREPIRRTVAIKVIKLGMDTRQVVARFESERQTLAVMNHPNVAKVLDAGATETGRPYFVMEHVPGEPITTFCDRQRFSLRQRLELFTQACEAVQHAHQKAIIHRDLKPTNILVTLVDGKSQVKVIDFGVAKAIAHKLTERTLFTETGQLLGTPEYMAPEQAEADTLIDVDTRCDVYSLGVVLYELLSGALPFDFKTLRSAGYAEVQRIIRDTDPPRPSARLSGLGNDAHEVAKARDTQLGPLEKQLKGELEWIPLKAMRKDRTQRYATATALAEDIKNYLAQRPLIAGPESAAYHARKFVRRHKVPLTAAAAVLLVLAAGVVVTSLALVGQSRARADAERERDSAKATLGFLTNDLLAGATPERIPNKEVRDEIVRAIITPAIARVESAFKGRPLVEASIRDAIAVTLHAIGRSDLALPHAQWVLSTRRRELGNDHRDTVHALNLLGSALGDLAKLDDAEANLREAMERGRRMLGPDDRLTLEATANLGLVLAGRGKFSDAEPLHRDVLEYRRRVLGDDDPATLTSMNYLAVLLRAQGKLRDAEALHREVLDRRRRTLGESELATLDSMQNLGATLEAQGRFTDAEQLYRVALEQRRRVQGDDHPSTILLIMNMGAALYHQAKFEPAEPLMREAVERSNRVNGDDHPLTLKATDNLGALLQAQGKLVEAETLWRGTVEIWRRIHGDAHPDTLTALNNVGVVLMMQGKPSDAESLLREVVDVRRRVQGESHPETLNSCMNLAQALELEGKLPEAEQLTRDSLERYRTTLGAEHVRALNLVHRLGRICAAQDKHADAEPLFAELHRAALAGHPDPKRAAQFSAVYGQYLVKRGRYGEAEQPLKEAIERLRATAQQSTESMRSVLTAMAEVCERTGREKEAADWRAELAALKGR